MKRLLATLVIAVFTFGVFLAVPASAKPPANPCKLLTKKQVKRLLLDHKVVKVQKRTQGDIAECTWHTKFIQNGAAGNPFGLELTIQPTDTAEDALDELRSRSADIDDNVDKIDGIGDEAYSHFASLIVVDGDIIFEVGVNNYDTSKPPMPDVDAIAQDAAKLVLKRL
jgi:hypothetical protein